MALLDPKAKYCLYVNASQSVLGAVLSQVPNKTEKELGYFGCKFHDADRGYPVYDRELFGIRHAILYWKFNLHGAEHPFLVHTDDRTLHWILTQPHLMIGQIDILTVLGIFNVEVMQILGVKNHIVDTLSHRLDFGQERCNVMALDVSAAREWIDDIKAGIVYDEWFGSIKQIFTNRSHRPPPSPAPALECTSQVSAQRFDLEENGLLWLGGDFERKQAEKNAWAKKHDGEEVEIMVQANEKKKNRKAETKEEGQAEKRGLLCIPKTMQHQILQRALDTPAGGHFCAN